MTGQLLERLEGHKDSVYSVAFMPDGKTLVSGSLDKTLRMWQLGERGYDHGKSPACIQTFTGHKVSFFSFFFFWDPISVMLIILFSQDFVLSVATTPDGSWIVSGSKDRGVQFWDPKTGQTQFMLQGHKNSGK
jgi:glucose repression regulatory protein TUP1